MISALLFCGRLSAQPLQWQGVISGADNNNYYLFTSGNSVCVDAMKNIYVAGAFYGTMQLDTATLQSAGTTDMFVAKFDAAGHLIWARTGGGNNDDAAAAVNIDAQGNVYVGGFFLDTAMFGPIRLISAGWEDIFMAKYSPNGDLVWATRAGGRNHDRISYYGGGMKLDNAGHFYITGGYDTMITFDTITLATYDEYNSTYLAKYDTSGHVVWAKSAGGKRGSGALDLNVDNSKNVLITGSFSGPNIYFDNIKLNATDNGYGFSDMFIAKYDSTGKALWARDAGGDNSTGGGSIITDNNDNVFVTGSMNSNTTVFDGINLHCYSAYDNGFIARYDANGNIQWAKNMGINGGDYNDGNYLVIDSEDNLYVTGQVIGNSYFNNDTGRGYGGNDAFVAKYDSAGNGKWFTRGGGRGNDIGFGIALDKDGSVYNVGFFEGVTATFGSCTASGIGINAYIAKLSASTGVSQVFKPANNIAVYPVPANESVTVDMGKGTYSSIRIVDAMGRCMYASITGQQKNTINTAAFAAGIYFVTVSGNSGSVSEKIIIEH